MRLCLIAACIVVLFGGALAAQTAPPKPLHKAGDHWTAYDPPLSFPEGTQVYVIKPGDTLWDLAKMNLGNPFLWPQIWEQNKYITDAHWIYPGDPLILPKKMESVPAAPAAAAAPGEEVAVPKTEENPTAEGTSPEESETPSFRHRGGCRYLLFCRRHTTRCEVSLSHSGIG